MRLVISASEDKAVARGFVLDAGSGEPLSGAKVQTWVRRDNGYYQRGPKQDVAKSTSAYEMLIELQPDFARNIITGFARIELSARTGEGVEAWRSWLSAVPERRRAEVRPISQEEWQVFLESWWHAAPGTR